MSGVESISGTLLETISAVLVKEPPALALTVPVISMLALAPGAKLPTDQMPVLLLYDPLLPVNEKPVGRMSRTSIPVAVWGEVAAFVTVRRNVAELPDVGLDVSNVLLSERSA